MADSTSSMPVGATGAGGGNTLRITGLNTGLDIDAMVKKMLTADQTKVDQAKQQQQIIQWRQEAYQSIIKDVKDLQSTYFDITNSANYLLSSGSYNNMTAASSDGTTVSGKASATATAGNYKILVKQLASGANLTGSKIDASSGSSTKLSDLGISGNISLDLDYNNGGTAGNKPVKFTVTGSSTIQDLEDAIKNQTGGAVTAKFNELTNQFSIQTSATGSSSTLSIIDNNAVLSKLGISNVKITGEKITAPLGSSTKLTDLGFSSGNISFSLSYNNEGTLVNKSLTFAVTNSSTIKDLADAINDQTGGAVTAEFDEPAGQFSIRIADTENNSELYITDNDDVLNKLGINNVNEENKTVTAVNGKDALVAIKEPSSSDYIVSRQSSNNFTVNGVTYSISDVNSTDENISVNNVGGKFDTISASDTPTSISVTQDTSKAHDLITNFIDKYNNLVGEIQDKLSEKKDYDYSPLTDAQKEEMSDTDITNWENKAKEGILRNDDNLQQLLDDLTSAFNTPVVDSSENSVSTIYFGSIGDNALGIDTSNDYTQGGKLSITDDQQFTDALTNHADEIMKLFTTTSDNTDSTKKFNQSGIFQRISDIIDKNVGVIGTTLNSGTLTKYANLQDDYTVMGGGGTGTLPDQIYQQQLLINTLTDRMNDDQTKYYNQFTQLEVAMEQLNAQQSTLSLYLG